MYSLKQAAEAAGRGKPAILKAIRSGRISAKKNEMGQWEIDPVELHRVYPLVTGSASGTGSGERQETPKETLEIKVLETKVEALKQQLSRERETVNDLRQRLDKSEDERRKTTEQLTGLLTHQQEETAQQKPPQNRIARAWAVLTGRDYAA